MESRNPKISSLNRDIGSFYRHTIVLVGCIYILNMLIINEMFKAEDGRIQVATVASSSTFGSVVATLTVESVEMLANSKPDDWVVHKKGSSVKVK